MFLGYFLILIRLAPLIGNLVQAKQNITKMKINKTFINWTNIVHEYRKAPYWAHYFLMSSFLISFSLYQISTLVSYADDNSPFAICSSELEVIKKLRVLWKALLSGFGIII